jgi:hypothetical protein
MINFDEVSEEEKDHFGNWIVKTKDPRLNLDNADYTFNNFEDEDDNGIKSPAELEISKKPSIFKKAPWILYMIFSTIAFTSCNLSISHITSYGPTGIFYFATGTILCGFLNNVIELCGECRQHKECKLWVPQKIIVDGCLDDVNLLAFMCFCCIYQMN